MCSNRMSTYGYTCDTSIFHRIEVDGGCSLQVGRSSKMHELMAYVDESNKVRLEETFSMYLSIRVLTSTS